MKKLFLMVGCPASGKSTVAQQIAEKEGGVVVSRDGIRFRMLNKNDYYFAKEDAVFDTYIREIEEALKENEAVIIDATHLSAQSRHKVLLRLNLTDVSVRPVVMTTPLEVALERNENREGRTYVPRSVVKRMYFQMTDPKNDTLHHYDEIIYVQE